MDGMLSQDEINALLNGVDLSADSDGSAATATAQDGGEFPFNIGTVTTHH